jgi:hypothetical protein
MSENEKLHVLINETTRWVMGIIDQQKAIPRVLVGVKPDGRKFALILSGTKVNQANRDSFIKTVLQQERCTMYAYSTLVGTAGEGDSDSADEELIICAATDSEFVSGSWLIERDNDKKVLPPGKAEVLSGENPQQQSFSWHLAFTDVDDTQRQECLEIWNDVQHRVRWMNPK